MRRALAAFVVAFAAPVLAAEPCRLDLEYCGPVDMRTLPWDDAVGSVYVDCSLVDGEDEMGSVAHKRSAAIASYDCNGSNARIRLTIMPRDEEKQP